MASGSTQQLLIPEEDDKALRDYGFQINHSQGRNAILGTGVFGRVLKGTCLEYAKRRVFDGQNFTEVSLAGMPCAIKVLNPIPTGADANTLKQLRDKKHTEAKILMDMSHPNLVTNYLVLQSNKTTYFVMEFVNGTTLTNFMNLTRLEDRTIQIFKQLTKGLQYLHSLGMMHGDLHGNNIMIVMNRAEVLVKIVDFGNSKALQNSNHLEDLLFLGMHFEKMTETTIFSTPNLQQSLRQLSNDLKNNVFHDINQVIQRLNEILPPRYMETQPS